MKTLNLFTAALFAAAVVLGATAAVADTYYPLPQGDNWAQHCWFDRYGQQNCRREHLSCEKAEEVGFPRTNGCWRYFQQQNGYGYGLQRPWGGQSFQRPSAKGNCFLIDGTGGCEERGQICLYEKGRKKACFTK